MSTFRYNAGMDTQRLPLNPTMRRKFRRIRNLPQLQQLNPVELEYFVSILYEKEGYVLQTYGPGENGNLLLARKGPESILVQVRRPGETVTEAQVRDLYSAQIHAGADRAAMATTGAISRAAAAWVAGKPVTLLDGQALVEWHKRLRSAARPAWLMPAIWVGVVVLGLFICLGLSALAFRPLGNLVTAWLAQPTIPPVPTVTSAPGGETPAATETTPPNIAPTITRPAPAGTIAVPFLETTPVIDGNLTEWPAGPTVVSSYRVYSAGGWDGSDDLEANWQLGWTNAGLFFGVTVLDDRHVQIQTGRLAYQGDSLEVQLDTDVSGDYGPTVSADDYQFLFSPGDFGSNPPSAFRFQGDAGIDYYRDAEGFQAVADAQSIPGGYILEAFIPWTDIGFTPQGGMEIGVSLNATDNDTPQTAIQEVMYATSRTRRHTDPTTWGLMILQTAP